MILAGDVGGTHTRLALFEPSGNKLEKITEQIYSSRDFPGLEAIVLEFLKGRDAKGISAGIGVAGPVRDGICVATNLPWTVNAAQVTAAAGLSHLELLNDLEANAYGIATLETSDLAVLQPGTPDPHGNAAVISAGTGLGEAGMIWDGTALHPFAAEGGHSSFAPQGDLQAGMYLFLMKKFGHVSCERVLSGPGLANIYEFLRDTGHGQESSSIETQMKSGDPAAVISAAALAGTCDLCAKALDVFVLIYAAEAGNLALKMLATAGVYLGGGIAPKIVEKLKSPAFLEAFAAKGRMKPLMQAIPVFVILNENTALFGAARAALLHQR
jgi:glucokinase